MKKTDLLDLARKLTDKDWAILESLRDKGAATATDIAVRLRVMPEDVRPNLESFATLGLAEVAPVSGAFEHEVYRLTEKGRAVLLIRLPHLV